MERDKAKAVLEAVLFTMGEAVDIGRLMDVIEEDKKTTREILAELKESYERPDSGIELIQLGDSFQLCTKNDYYDYLIKIAKAPRQYTLSDTALETLSIIAYKQPVTKLDVERIRGVNCDHAVNKLVELDLVAEIGRKDAPGSPILFGTTQQFLRSFGIQSLEDLPELSQVQMEEFREQVEREIAADEQIVKTVQI